MNTELEKPKKRGRPKKSDNGSKPSSDLSQKKSAEKSYLVIDHPKNGEELAFAHHYAIRIGAGGGDGVEISIDNGTWQACRNAVGYYWYDWHSIPKGTHTIVARMQLPNGKTKKSKITRCTVS